MLANMEATTTKSQKALLYQVRLIAHTIIASTFFRG